MNGTDTILAVISLLHEPANLHSGNRRFRDRPVLEWTLCRLSAASLIDVTAVHCWDDQFAAVSAAVGDRNVAVTDRGPRKPTPAMVATTAARRWADGWRGGLLGTCDFDLGFHAEWVAELAAQYDADAVLLVDPASALVDPGLVDAMIEHAADEAETELYFTQAAPGLAGTLVRRQLVDRLAIACVHPGRLLTYFPDQHGVDPVGRGGCVPVPMSVARTLEKFKLDSDRQVARFDRAYAHLNGQLINTDASGLVSAGRDVPQPRDINLEMTTRRATAPVYLPTMSRPDPSVDIVFALCRDLPADARLTLGGLGDPLVRPDWAEIVSAVGGRPVHVETDLLTATEIDLRKLVELGVDVVSVHLPAATAATYQRVMGVDGFGTVMANVAKLEAAVAGVGTPLIAMTFTKLADNLGEMEVWYDYWIRRHGHAVIVPPGLAPGLAVADMTPPKRRACVRLSSQLTVLSDGQFVPCNQDVTATMPLGRSADSAWHEIGLLRSRHDRGDYGAACESCREWNRR